MKLYQLIYPEINAQINNKQGQYTIFDPIRRKHVALTPEEWVRQHIIHYLTHHIGYSRSLIKCETGIMYNQLPKRPDLLVYNKLGQVRILIECKAPEVRLTRETIVQLSMYANVVKPEFLVASNGLSELVFRVYNGQLATVPCMPKPDL